MRRSVLLLPVLLIGCSPSPLACEIELAEAESTVPVVSWTAPGPGPGWVEYGLPGEEPLQTPTVEDDTVERRFPLLGLPALADLTYTAVSEVDGRRHQCEGAFATGGLPSGLADATVTVDRPDLRSDERFLLAGMAGEGNGILAFDREGRRVWYRMAPAHEIWNDVQIARDGGGILHNVADAMRSVDIGAVEAVSYEGEAEGEVPLPMAHHVFRQLEGDRIAYLAAEIEPWTDPETGEDWEVVGDALRVVGPEGTVEIANTWDWMPVAPHSEWQSDFYPGLKDWTHGNALDHDAERDTWLITFRNLAAVAEVDGQTGMPLRWFGGDVPGGYHTTGAPLRYPHDGSWTPDGTLLVVSSPGEETLAVEFAIDEDNHVLQEIWSYGLDEGLHATSLGQARRLPNGNTLVNFGDAGVIREVTPEGEVAWELVTASGSWFGQVRLVDDLYGG